MKLILPLIAVVTLAFGSSCTTMYDAHGRPTEVVTPEGAAMAAVAAGVLGYAIGDSKKRKRHYGRHDYGHHGGHYGHGGHRGRSYCY